MDTQQTKRQQQILKRLETKGEVEIKTLCEEFNITAPALQKELKQMELKGLLFRTPSGISLHNPYTTTEQSVDEKEKRFAKEKARIAAAAVQLITQSDSILIASGTTMLALAKAIVPKGNLTVITAALNVAIELIKHEKVEVLQLGGYIRHSSTSVTGVYAERTLAEVSCSKLFMGADGIDLDFGLTTTNLSEARLNQQMIASVQETIILADSSKFGKRGFGKVCGIDQISHIITDKGISNEIAKKIQNMGIELTIV